MCKISAYCRVSTNKSEQEDSLENQIAYYKEQGVNENDIYFDKGISGTSLDRDSFKTLLYKCGLDIKQVKSGRKSKLVVLESSRNSEYQYIYAKSISRFSRNISEGIEIIRALKSKGCYCKFLQENIDTKESSSEFLLNMLLVMSQNESQNISERVRFGNLQTAKNGHVRSFNLYGYTYSTIDKRLYINEEEAKVVKLIYQYRLEGLGQRRIANRLNEEGYLNKSGKTWSASSVKNVLNNPTYTGYVVRNRYNCNTLFGANEIKQKDKEDWIIIESDNVPKIIDKDTYLKARELTNKATVKGKGANTGISELAQKIKCKCGANYTRNIDCRTQRVFYNCTIKKKQGVSKCQSRNVYQEEIDKTLEMYLGSGYKTIANKKVNSMLFKDIDNHIQSIKDNYNEDNTELINKNNQTIAELKIKQSKLLELYLGNSISKDILDNEGAKINGEISRLENENNDLNKGYEEVEKKIKSLETLKEAIIKMVKELPDNMTREEFIDNHLIYISVKESYLLPITQVDQFILDINKIIK